MRPSTISAREFALFVHDFALLFDKRGNALNPPEVPGSHDNPATPILETYPGDELYYFGGIDDVWLGLWGIIRAYDKPQKRLKPLCKNDIGDLRNHRYHGLFAAILIEPPGAKWYQAFSSSAAKYEEEALIAAPGILSPECGEFSALRKMEL